MAVFNWSFSHDAMKMAYSDMIFLFLTLLFFINHFTDLQARVFFDYFFLVVGNIVMLLFKS